MLRVDDCVVLRRVSMGGGEENPEPPTEVGSRRTSNVLKNELLLHEAVIKNDPDAVKRVIKEPLDVNSRNNYGRAPIHWASSRGNTEIMEMLINAKCDIEAKDKYGMRPILMAAWHGHTDAVQMLINYGASVNTINKKQYTLLMCAARNNRLSVVNFLLDTIEDVGLDAFDTDHQTALHHAAIAGHTHVVRRLVHAGANTSTTNKQGRTPLHSACEKGHVDVVEFLLGHGADMLAKDEEQNSPLHVAVENKQTLVVQMLLEAGNPTNLENSKGLTALHIASSHGCRGIVEMLLSADCDIDRQSKNGNTPLHMACLSNNVVIAEILIAKGADLNALNTRLQSPIHIAAEQGYSEICKLLLSAGANIEQREQGGKTPLYIAARGSFTAIVDMIIKTARLEYTPKKRTRPKTPEERRKWKCNPDLDVSIALQETDENLEIILRKLSHKQLSPGEWKKLAHLWAFTDEQIKAIEHQYIGPSSYKQHGYRVLRIWVDSLGPDLDPIEELIDSLNTIEKNALADAICKKLMRQKEKSEKKPEDKTCVVS
ncbi:ankyrin repeat and death domain-containing protein 1A-like [Rhopalosiphum padi]|uniref:ankyrin repeat and death domain-containing protein 1A-like n=1 Tax=Rhopalosiphum padi TaxID=40932 RepID=UPI00298EAA28|nr:ankyrin repeat and death domain-containing protein 1A-like [Rhopalosiphum padi]